jgi:hypothetical protein
MDLSLGWGDEKKTDFSRHSSEGWNPSGSVFETDEQPAQCRSC